MAHDMAHSLRWPDRARERGCWVLGLGAERKHYRYRLCVSTFTPTLEPLANVIDRFFLCPETGGKTLEQVDYLFQKPLAISKNADLEDAEEAWTENKGAEAAPKVRTNK